MIDGMRPGVRWIVLLGVAILVALGVGLGYQRERQARARDDFAAEASNVGLSAALTADMVRWAHRQCSAIGMATLDACGTQGAAAFDGRLAAPLARMVISQYDSWTTRCNRHFTPSHCQDLIDRELKARGVAR